MIAAGLCLMGGCFAQEVDSRTVETYWFTNGIEVADRSPFYALLLLEFPYGDSGSDCISFGGFVDYERIDSGVASWSSILGVASSGINASQFRRDGCWLRNNTYSSCCVDFLCADRTYEFALPKGKVEVRFEYGKFDLRIDDMLMYQYSGVSYVVPDEVYLKRRFIITNSLCEFYYGSYVNSNTGISFLVLPMKTVQGNRAVWETYGNSLTEI